MANGKKIKIVGFGGSLRKGSYNHSILEAAAGLLPENTGYEIAEIYDIPLFNTDLEESAFPASVTKFKKIVGSADALLIAVPEHNFTFAAVIKNVMEWGTRPYPDNVFKDKPVALASASTGYFGGVRAQLAFRQTLLYVDTFPLKNSLTVSMSEQKFDEGGTLKDNETKEKLKKLLAELTTFTLRLKGGI